MRRSLGFACVVLVAFVAWRLVRVTRDGELRSSSSEAQAVEEGEPARVELRTPGAVPVDTAGEEKREALDSRPRGPLAGQLVDAETRHPLRRDLMLLVGTPDNEVVVWMRAKEDGSFTSEREFPRGTVKAWVKDPDTGQLLVRHEAAFDPEAGGPWLVPVPAPEEPAAAVVDGEDVDEHPTKAALRGRVVDLEARPVESAVMKLLPRARPGRGEEPMEPPWSDTDADGDFHVDGLEPGAYLVLAQGAFARAEPFVVTLEPGENRVDPIVLPCASSPGSIRGTLVPHDRNEETYGVLVLRDPASGKELVFFSAEGERGATPFELRGIPAGEYELSVVSIDGRAWEPRSLLVSPPTDGIEFHQAGGLARRFALRARDARSGAEVAETFALGRVRGQWVAAFVRSGAGTTLVIEADRWLAHAPGYRPAAGDFSHAERAPREREPVETFVVDVALERGFGAVFVFKDLESDALLVPELDGYFGPGLAGVEVLADGRPVARSDADGLALVSLEREPGRLEFSLAGWHSVASRDEDGMRLVHMVRD